MPTDPATKQDLKDAIADLKQWILEREVATIRWSLALLVGTQVTYFVITFFMLQRLGH